MDGGRPNAHDEPVATETDTIQWGTSKARWVLAVTVGGSGVAMLDATTVNVALPALGRDLGASVADLQWTVNAYTLTVASLILLAGSLADRFGRRRVFMIGNTMAPKLVSGLSSTTPPQRADLPASRPRCRSSARLLWGAVTPGRREILGSFVQELRPLGSVSRYSYPGPSACLVLPR
jgi:MFS family permease